MFLPLGIAAYLLMLDFPERQIRLADVRQALDVATYPHSSAGPWLRQPELQTTLRLPISTQGEHLGSDAADVPLTGRARDAGNAPAAGKGSTTRVAVMQPYFFPYIGYFQLMAACDVFLVFDDAQYIDRGWINRNRILVNGTAQWITAPVAAASHELPILEREYLLRDRLALRLPSRLAGAYRSAPFFAQTMPLIEDVLAFPQPGVAAFNTNLLRRLAAHLGIKTPIGRTSELDKDDSLVGGERRVIDICVKLGATAYINPIGGRHLYSADAFAEQGIELRFLSCEVAPYPQFGAPHVPLLSIIDVLMFNDVPAVRGMLEQYALLPGL